LSKFIQYFATYILMYLWPDDASTRKTVHTILCCITYSILIINTHLFQEHGKIAATQASRWHWEQQKTLFSNLNSLCDNRKIKIMEGLQCYKSLLEFYRKCKFPSVAVSCSPMAMYHQCCDCKHGPCKSMELFIAYCTKK